MKEEEEEEEEKKVENSLCDIVVEVERVTILNTKGHFFVTQPIL